MTLKSKFYYQRRFSLTILYIVMSLLFLSFPIMGLFEPSSKKELEYFNDVAQKISIEYKKHSKEEYIKLLVIGIKDKTLKAVINNNEFKLLTKSLDGIVFEKTEEKIIIETPIDKIELKNSFVKEKDLNALKIEGYETKGVIKELKINDTIVLSFKKTSKILYAILIGLAMLWLLWQIKILFHLIKNKPIDLYK